MIEQPLVSIVTPSFNQALFLQKTITSVLDQDYPAVEYFVVDGGSQDGSLDVIQKNQKKLSWWISEPDLGQADAINKGIHRSKGQIFAWLNSDDYYLPGAISKVVSFLKKNPKIAFVYGDVLAVDANDIRINLLRYKPYNLSDLLRFNIIGQPSVFVNKEFIEKAGLLDLSYKYLLDHHFWIRLAMLGPIQYLPVTLSVARFHSFSKNIAQANEFGQEAFRIVDWMQGNPELKNMFFEDKNKILAGAHRINARYLLDGGKARESLIAYLQSLRCHPAAAMKEWHRILFAFFSMMGNGKMNWLRPHWRK